MNAVGKKDVRLPFRASAKTRRKHVQADNRNRILPDVLGSGGHRCRPILSGRGPLGGSELRGGLQGYEQSFGLRAMAFEANSKGPAGPVGRRLVRRGQTRQERMLTEGRGGGGRWPPFLLNSAMETIMDHEEDEQD